MLKSDIRCVPGGHLFKSSSYSQVPITKKNLFLLFLSLHQLGTLGGVILLLFLKIIFACDNSNIDASTCLKRLQKIMFVIL